MDGNYSDNHQNLTLKCYKLIAKDVQMTTQLYNNLWATLTMIKYWCAVKTRQRLWSPNRNGLVAMWSSHKDLQPTRETFKRQKRCLMWRNDPALRWCSAYGKIKALKMFSSLNGIKKRVQKTSLDGCHQWLSLKKLCRLLIILLRAVLFQWKHRPSALLTTST